MARIVFVWELGGGLGHIQNELPLALKLQSMGHEVLCVMQHVIDAGRIMGPHGIKVMQAPVWQVKVKKLENTFNYAEALFNQGYLVEGGLSCMLHAWRNLFDFIMPDMVIADHAPTALLATRGTNIKTVMYGTGFGVPPIQSPMPSIIPWVKAPDKLFEYSEREAVRTINRVLGESAGPLLKNLADLFAVDENFLVTFEEMDHYQKRQGAKYWGPIIARPAGQKPEWPAVKHSKRIFCYLKPTYPHLGEVLSSLQQVEASVIIFLPKMPPAIKKKFHSANMQFVEKPLNMAEVCEESAMVICHAGHGTVAKALLHGKPLLLLPEANQLEQVLIARNIAKRDLGLYILAGPGRHDYKKVINRVLFEGNFTAAARNFAQKYNDFDPVRQQAGIAERCEEILHS